jgi:hypothetical protein
MSKPKFKSKLKPLSKREAGTLKREREFIKEYEQSVIDDTKKLYELRHAYSLRAARCPHVHPSGKTAMKKSKEPCPNPQCSNAHKFCTICGFFDMEDVELLVPAPIVSHLDTMLDLSRN